LTSVAYPATWIPDDGGKRKVKRRPFLLSAAASTLPLPAIAQPAENRTLTFTPRTDLGVLDPIWSTGAVTLAHGYCVFDTLYGVDDAYRAHPQMAEGHTVADDGLTWSIRLREGLVWHDGEQVLARDCVASLRRWSQRDTFGMLLASYVDEWLAEDDHTIRVRLKRPFGVLPDALAHPSSSAAFMMPERIAKTPPTEQIKEMIGSGPLRFVKDEYQPGNHVGYARFNRYVPRQEPPSGTAGGKRVYFDRIDWKIIPDDATVAVALRTGEIDWWELMNPEYFAGFAKNPNLRIEVYDPYGINVMMRFNCAVPPFDNPKLRRAVLAAVDQTQFMPAIGGDVPDGWRPCYALFTCGIPGVNQIGKALMTGTKDFERLRDAVKASGYAGEKVVIINAADYSMLAPLGPIAADLLTKLGLNVDLQESDFGTLMQRRNSRASADKGGWSVFLSLGASAVAANPGLDVYVQASGKNGWYGWYDNPKVVALTQQWVTSTTEKERETLIDAIQTIAFEDAPTVPLGQYFPHTAMRRNLTGFLPGSAAVPWNIRRVQ
jgi:peptide/nickel transport system substrate-binding protein